MIRIAIALPLLLGLLLGCQSSASPARVEAPPDSAAGEIAIAWAGPNEAALTIPVYINGAGPYDFVLDTGATLTCVDEGLATELSLPEPVGQIGMGAGVGSAGRLRLVTLDSLRVGGARAEDLPACAIDLGSAQQLGIDFDGLLGLNFLRSFRVVLDFQREILTLQQP